MLPSYCYRQSKANTIYNVEYMFFYIRAQYLRFATAHRIALHCSLPAFYPEYPSPEIFILCFFDRGSHSTSRPHTSSPVFTFCASLNLLTSLSWTYLTHLHPLLHHTTHLPSPTFPHCTPVSSSEKWCPHPGHVTGGLCGALRRAEGAYEKQGLVVREGRWRRGVVGRHDGGAHV